MSAKQRGAIFAIAGKAGLNNDALHDVVLKLTGVDSIARLTGGQAIKVINHLKKLTGQQAPLGWLTDAQRGKIYALSRELGWVTDRDDVDMARLEGFIRARFKVEKLAWVRMDTGGKVIEALRKMAAGGRGERKPTRKKNTTPAMT